MPGRAGERGPAVVAALPVTGTIVRIVREAGGPTARQPFETLVGPGAQLVPGHGVSVRVLPG